jgi:hypothetical protein
MKLIVIGENVTGIIYQSGDKELEQMLDLNGV